MNFLAYCGTMGVPFMDYIVADGILIPEANEQYYAEQVVRLPHTYMPNDNTCAIAERTPSRVEAGLPESGFVFTSDNGEHTFGPFLDTLPYNAHGTASDALWAGLPVLTCTGNTFACRVAASPLHAVAMPELVTSSLVEYEQAALTLAREPARLSALRAKLMRNRQTEALFDTARFTRDLEYAYAAMQTRHERGMSPAALTVPDGLNSVAA